MKKTFFKLMLIFITTLLLLNALSLKSFAEGQSEFDGTQKSIDNYINGQLDKINIDEIQNYLNEDEVLNKVELKTFIKDLFKGDKNILDLFSKDGIKMLLFDEFKASLKVVSVILVLALLSAVLKSLDNSFASGAVSQIATYIIFITMVSLTLVGFKDVLEICYNSIDRTISLMQILMPILISFLLLIGFPITSTTLNPIFLGGVTFINVVFKKFLFTSMIVAFGVLIINNLSKNLKLKKMFSFIKQFNLVSIGAMFTVYLGLVSLQGLYVTSFDKFSMKTAKFAVGNFIPVVGGFVSDSIDIILSSSQLIKNIFGGIGLVILIGICLVPIIKIISVIFVYKAVAIAVEPIGEESISSFLNEVANLMIIMLASVIAISVMFFVTIAILTSISVVGRG
ncbi:stage III sporulation protein AE [Clostridioides mangenotii]|uniref:stage III sporulation protein AE n=1 Tax=Metaclostridioides mangenotii TaxID=1540 RepID=UPI002149D9D7|nr:stage III sporulation protein AE [Clostridioides mangenotii]MCR1953509.1 stage III sporulation protein AE [Clostridioides mangenotii]